MYAIAAVAVALLVLTHTSEAKIVYTKTNVVIQNGAYNLDLNHDGTTDFTIQQNQYKTKCLKLLEISASQGASTISCTIALV